MSTHDNNPDALDHIDAQRDAHARTMGFADAQEMDEHERLQREEDERRREEDYGDDWDDYWW